MGQVCSGTEGFEPPIPGPKPVALPLGHAPFLVDTNKH